MTALAVTAVLLLGVAVVASPIAAWRAGQQSLDLLRHVIAEDRAERQALTRALVSKTETGHLRLEQAARPMVAASAEVLRESLREYGVTEDVADEVLAGAGIRPGDPYVPSRPEGL